MSGRASLGVRFDQRLSRVKDATLDVQQTRAPLAYVHVDRLSPAPHQARRDFTAVPRLGESILQRGVLVPLRVRETGPGNYEIISGEQRWRGARWAAQHNPHRAFVPCVVATAGDEDARQDGLHENLVRADLNRYEIARVVLGLLADRLGVDAEVARDRLARAGRPGPPPDEVTPAFADTCAYAGLDLQLSTFARFYLPLLNLPPDLIDALEQHGLPYTTALELRKEKDPSRRAELTRRALAGELSLSEARQAVRPAGAVTPPGAAVQRWKKLTRRASPQRLAALSPEGREELESLLARLEKLLR